MRSQKPIDNNIQIISIFSIRVQSRGLMRKDEILIFIYKYHFFLINIYFILLFVASFLACDIFFAYPVNKQVEVYTYVFLNNCQPCSFRPNPIFPSNSCQKDAILTIGINKLFNLLPFIRTLRTAGSKCRFILFLNNESMHAYEPKFYQKAKDCGVEFRVVKILEQWTKEQVWYIRFMIYKNFLIENKKEIRRVFFCDLYDTVIQHDPFMPEFKYDVLYLSNEGYPNKKSLISIHDLNTGFNVFNFTENQKKEILDRDIFNGGLQGGSTEIMIRFCDIMLKSGNPKTFEVYAIDQGYLNIIIYLGIFRRLINYTVLYPNSSMFSSMVRFSISRGWNKRNRRAVFGKIKIDGVVPGILHHYDRSVVVRRIVRRTCFNPDNFSDFIR